MLANTQEPTRGYALPMRIIHWLMAAMMLYVIIVGILMGNGFKVGVHYDYHRATGFLILLLISLPGARSPSRRCSGTATACSACRTHFTLCAAGHSAPVGLVCHQHLGGEEDTVLLRLAFTEDCRKRSRIRKLPSGNTPLCRAVYSRAGLAAHCCSTVPSFYQEGRSSAADASHLVIKRYSMFCFCEE